MIADLLSLAPSSLAPAKNVETETVGGELVISTHSGNPSLAREDSGPILEASKKDDRGSRLERLPFKKKGSRPAPQASKKGRRAPERLRTPEEGVKDFVPWVSPISSRPTTSEEEEDEDEMADLVHNFDARKRKRGANFKRATDVTPNVVGEADQHPTGEGSDVQAIVILDSPDMPFQGQLAPETAFSMDFGEVYPTHAEVQEDIPSK